MCSPGSVWPMRSIDNKEVVRAGFGLFTGPWDYSDLMVGWQGASAFTQMNNPLVPDFANRRQHVVGLGVSGVVGVSGPFLASQAFQEFYCRRRLSLSTDLAAVSRSATFNVTSPIPYAEQASLELESSLGMGWILTTGYQYMHGMKMPVYLSVNGTPSGNLPDGRQAFTPADPAFRIRADRHPLGVFHLQRRDRERAQKFRQPLQRIGQLHLLQVH